MSLEKPPPRPPRMIAGRVEWAIYRIRTKEDGGPEVWFGPGAKRVMEAYFHQETERDATFVEDHCIARITEEFYRPAKR